VCVCVFVCVCVCGVYVSVCLFVFVEVSLFVCVVCVECVLVCVCGVCVCMCVTYLHHTIHTRFANFIRKNYFHDFLIFDFESSACSISTPPLLICDNNILKNIDL